MVADPTRISDPAVRVLARQLAQQQREIDLLKQGQRSTQLGNSSVEGGTLWFNDGAGVQRVGIGAQIDGKFGWFAVNGEAPPAPNTPQLLPSVNGVAIVWNGQFTGPAPSDFTHVKAYLSPVGQSFIPSEGNLVGHFIGGATLPVTPLEPGINYWCVLIAYNTSDVASDPSFVAGPVSPTAVVATEILDGIVTDLKLADGAVSRAKIAVGAVGTAQIGNQQVDLSKLANGSVDATKIVDGSITPAKVTFTAQDIGSVATYNQASAPSGTVPQGSLWFDGSKLRRYAGSSWFELTDAGIANALSAAQQAQTDAANALTTASGAQSAVNSKVTVFYQGTAPSGANTGDLWLNTAANNSLQRWSGSAWAPVSDTRIATALANAQTAQATADGKITAFYQATAPTTGMAVGDFWYKSDAGNLPHRWNGTTWVPLPLGSGAIADGSIIAAKLANGSVTLGKLADGSVPGTAVVTDAITADKIATGAVGSGELATGSVIAGKVAAGVIGTNELAANSVVAGKVAANTIGANELIANSIVAGKLAADSVASTNIIAGAIQAGHLAVDSVAAGKIAAEAVTARELKALSVLADKIAANQIQAGHLQAGAVTADKLEAILALVSTLVAGDPNGWRTEIGDAVTPLLYWDGQKTGFAVSRDQATGQANVYMSGRVEFGNGSSIEQDYIDLCEQPAAGVFRLPVPRQQRTLIYSEPIQTPSPVPSWVSATARGNLLYMAVEAVNYAGTGAPTISVPSGWQLIRTVTGGASGSTRMSTYYIAGSAHTASRTTEAISANVPCSWAIGMLEPTGMQTATPLDVSQAASGSGTAANTGTTAVPAQGNEFQIAAFGTPGAGVAGKSGFSAPTNGFSTATEGGGYKGQGLMVATKVVTGALAASAGATVTPSNPWLASIATFRTGLAPAVPTTPPAKVVRLFTRSLGGESTPWVVSNTGRTYPVGRVPYCAVALTGNFTLAANLDVWAQSGWNPTDDPYGMVSISGQAGTFSSITIPVAGRYLINYRAIYEANVDGAVNAACFINKNTRDFGNSIARDSRRFTRYGSGDHSPVQAIRPVTLEAGSILYWGNWSQISTNVFANVAGLPTEITVTYVGSN